MKEITYHHAVFEFREDDRVPAGVVLDFYNQHVHILSAFGHPVAVCCDMLGVVGSAWPNARNM